MRLSPGRMSVYYLQCTSDSLRQEAQQKEAAKATFIVSIFSLETGLVIVWETPAGKSVTVDGDEHRSAPSASQSSWSVAGEGEIQARQSNNANRVFF